jgi:UDP-N-acetylmuramoyl-tripeptide--D-alanyl-D-alanine ligase
VASYNNQWGVPLTLARTPPEADFCVVEIGMNHAGEIAPLSRLAGPDVAVITAVEPAHIGHLGSLEAIADEKASIAQGVLKGGTLVIPADGPMAPRLRAAARNLRVLTFGAENLLLVLEDCDGTDVTADIAGTQQAFRVGAPGRHMVMNAVAALTAASAVGADLQAGAQALAGFAPLGGRGTRRAILGGEAILLDESYNASSASVRAALAVLKLTPARRRIAVLGDMLELGAQGAALHAALRPDIENAHVDAVFACGTQMAALWEVLPVTRRGAYGATSCEIAPVLVDALRGGDVVLVKGSLGSRMAVIIDALKTHSGTG